MAFFAVKKHSYFGDEGFHMEQIRLLLEGKMQMAPAITTLPGYHVVQAAIAKLVHMDTLNMYRMANLCFSGLSVLFFFLCLGAMGSRLPLARTLQYAFIPFLFPYFPLVYTDVLSLLFVLIALYATLKRGYEWATLAAFLSVSVRQNNIIWCVLFLLLFLDQEYRSTALLWLKNRWNMAIRKKSIVKTTQISAWRSGLVIGLYVVGFGLFGTFVWLNGGLAIGDKSAHPFPSLHIGNIVFLLMLLSVVLLPLHIANVRRLITAARQHALILLAVFFACFSLYLLFYHNDHGYNQDAHSVFLRNRILVFSVSSEFIRRVFFIPCFIALLSLGVTVLRKPAFYLLYPLTILYLLPSWLIEQRYYFIPLVLFLLFREERGKFFERSSALYGFVCTGALFAPVAMRWFFL